MTDFTSDRVELTLHQERIGYCRSDGEQSTRPGLMWLEGFGVYDGSIGEVGELVPLSAFDSRLTGDTILMGRHHDGRFILRPSGVVLVDGVPFDVWLERQETRQVSVTA